MALLSLSEKLATLAEAFPRETGVLRASEIAAPRRLSLLATGIGRLDALLSGGLPRGKLVEIVGGRSCGRLGIALSTLAAATRTGENAAFIDLGGHLDPRETQAAGAHLPRILWVRPGRLQDAVLAAEVVLSAGFSLVVADLGVPPLGRRVPDASWVRLARSAEGHASAFLLLTPYAVAGPASEAVVTVRRRRAAWSGTGDSPRLLCGIEARFTLEKKRGERPGRVEEARFETEEAIGSEARSARRRGPAGGHPAEILGTDHTGSFSSEIVGRPAGSAGSLAAVTPSVPSLGCGGSASERSRRSGPGPTRPAQAGLREPEGKRTAAEGREDLPSGALGLAATPASEALPANSR